MVYGRGHQFNSLNKRSYYWTSWSWTDALVWQPDARGRKGAASLLDHESSPALVFRYIISKKGAISGSSIAQ